MLKLLFNPSESIDNARTRKSFGLSFLTCVLGSLYLGVSAFLILFLANLQSAQTSLLFGLSVFIGAVAASFYSGWLLNVIMTTLVGKGTFWAGFTTRVYAMYIASFAGLIASVLWVLQLLLKNNLLTWGVYAVYGLLGPLVLAQALSAHLKAQKELYNTNMVTAIVGLFVLMLVGVATAFAISSLLPSMSISLPKL